MTAIVYFFTDGTKIKISYENINIALQALLDIEEVNNVSLENNAKIGGYIIYKNYIEKSPIDKANMSMRVNELISYHMKRK